MSLRPVLLAGSLLIGIASVASALPAPTQGVPPLQPSAGAADQALHGGLEALRAERRDEARQAFQAALRADPQRIEAMLGLSEVGFQSRNDAETLKWLQQAERIAPQRAEVQALLGRFYKARNQADKAEAALRKAVALDAKSIEARLGLAELLVARNAADQALPVLQQALQLDDKQARVHYAIGIAQLRQGAEAEAERALRRAAELEPKNPQPLLMLARLQKSAATALPLLDQVLQQQPEQVDALLLRARWQLGSKDIKGGRDSLQRAAKADPKSAEALVQLGMLDESEGRRGDARRNYLAAIERDPHQPVALNNLVMMGLADKEDPARLELMARRAARALPDNAAVHDTLAQTLRLRKDKAGALAAGQQAVKLDPKDPSLLMHLAELQHWSGDRAAARKSAEGVLALQAQGAEADKAKALLARL